MKKPFLEFLGSQTHPFLAPRGIHCHDQIIAISDTATNRILIWKSIPRTTYQEPDLILGEDTNEVTAASFYYPSGIWTNGEKLIVADAWNHRVLIWNQFPTENYQKADVVVGQEDFNKNLPNTDGVNSACTDRNLYWCYGVYSNGKALWIADTGNRRVLYFEKIPTENYQKADQVIGQINFETKDLNPENSTWPYSVKISIYGEMLINDTQYFRVLYWKNWEDAIHQKADLIIGQENFSDNGQNQYRLKPDSKCLNWNYDAIFDSETGHIFVADTGNSRILEWNQTPKKNNENADEVFGQLGFEEIGENGNSIMGKPNFLYWPFSITSNKNEIIVCETGNNRIFFYKKH